MFAYTLIDNCIERPDGLIIGIDFHCAADLTVSAVSRSMRSIEFRVSKAFFTDVESRRRIGAGTGGQEGPHGAEHGIDSPVARSKKKAEIVRHYSVKGPFLFVHVHLADNRSEFAAPLEFQILREEVDDYVAHVYGATAIANTIAFISEMIDPISIFIGLTRQNLMNQAVRYLLFGEGETGLLVYTVLLRYWEWTPEDDVRPLIFLMSD